MAARKRKKSAKKARKRQKTASLISVHMDLGAGRRGVDMGPSAIRLAGLSEGLIDLGWKVREAGGVHADDPETLRVGRVNARYSADVLDVCTRLRDCTIDALKKGTVPIVLGGDHSIAMGSVAGVAKYYRDRGEGDIGVLWIDAHTDMNVPDTSPSGNIHGMPMAHLLGRGIPALRRLAGNRPALHGDNVAQLGIRSVDKFERAVVKDLGARVYTMTEIDTRGFAECLAESIQRVTQDTVGFHVSFDLDGIDPRYAPGVGTPVQGGLTFREAHLVCEAAARTGKMLSMDVVELNPSLDERNRTGILARDLILSALGKTII